jgi:aryl-alcohol dehydrogenase-like predicted oxidoreductase
MPGCGVTRLTVVHQRDLGRTGLRVSVLGLGAGQIGEREVNDAEAAAVLHGALDAGVTLLDTARGYGSSEERIGRHLSGRRDEFVLSSKGGYDVPGATDWTPAAVRAGVDRALRRLRTEVIDVFHLHSCPLAVLRRGDLQDALDQAVAAGKVRVAAYSGDNQPLAHAAASGRFGSVETSANLADQWSLHHVLPRHPELGVIAKRPIANAPWRFPDRPVGHYAEVYWERLRRLALDPGGLSWDEFALRFSAYAPGVDSVIVGTSKPANLRRNADLVARGPLPPDLLQAVEAAWRREGADWPGEV